MSSSNHPLLRRQIALALGVFATTTAWPMAGLAQSADAESRNAEAEQPPPARTAGGRRIDEIRVEGRRAEAASEFALELQEYGTQVQLIDAKKLATGGFTNFGEAAAGLIRGANVGYSPDEGEFTIRIDGGTDRDTLLMVDGVPYFDRSSPLEDIWPATQIDPRMIDSVEIYRGGQSLYFGSNAGLGVVRVKTKQPDGTTKGEVGFYAGSFKTRELYGNVSFPLTGDGAHSVMFYGRSYETDAHTLFDEEAYSDNVLALGGFHEFPYSYNSVGAKYLWRVTTRRSCVWATASRASISATRFRPSRYSSPTARDSRSGPRA